MKMYLRHKVLTCRDEEGIIRKDGERWDDDQGRLCQCQVRHSVKEI